MPVPEMNRYSLFIKIELGKALVIGYPICSGSLAEADQIAINLSKKDKGLLKRTNQCFFFNYNVISLIPL